MARKGDLDAVAALAESYQGEPAVQRRVAVEADLHDELAGHGGAARAARLHRKQVRERQGVTCDQRRTRAVAEAAI